MFESIKKLFGAESLLDEAFNTTVTMLDFDYKMYDASRRTLRESNTDELPFDIKKTDIKINKYEREVRRKVVTHLTVSGTQNVVPGLVLVSIVIDVERIGDYTKNIYELAIRHPEQLQGGKHEESLRSIEAEIEKDFPTVIEVLKSHDVDKAREVMQMEQQTARNAEAIVDAMIAAEDPSISTKDAVALAMYARYLKRINAHLTNIASSVVNPFPRIGFREKKKKS
jgi:phosphate transport system protein